MVRSLERDERHAIGGCGRGRARLGPERCRQPLAKASLGVRTTAVAVWEIAAQVDGVPRRVTRGVGSGGGDIGFDVGAHAGMVEARAGVGAHTIALSRMIGPSGHLLAVEPRSVMQRALRQNLAVNRAFNVSLLCRGLGSRPVPGNSKARAQQDATLTGRVPETEGAVDTIDGLRLQRLDLLKIEEGAGAGDVLAGAAETLWRLRPRLYVGVPDAGALEHVCRQVREFGYRCWRHESALLSPVNVNRDEHEAFLGCTALALVGIPEEAQADAAFEGCTELG